MTPFQSVVTLSLLFCTAPPCVAAMAGPEPLVPDLPDTWWRVLMEAGDAGAALLDSTLGRAVAWLLPTCVLAWRYGPRHQTLVTAVAAWAPIVLASPHGVGRGHATDIPPLHGAATPTTAANGGAGQQDAHFQTVVGGFPASGISKGGPRLLGPQAGPVGPSRT